MSPRVHVRDREYDVGEGNNSDESFQPEPMASNEALQLEPNQPIEFAEVESTTERDVSSADVDPLGNGNAGHSAKHEFIDGQASPSNDQIDCLAASRLSLFNISDPSEEGAVDYSAHHDEYDVGERNNSDEPLQLEPNQSTEFAEVESTAERDVSSVNVDGNAGHSAQHDEEDQIEWLNSESVDDVGASPLSLDNSSDLSELGAVGYYGYRKHGERTQFLEIEIKVDADDALVKDENANTTNMRSSLESNTSDCEIVSEYIQE